MAIPVIFAVVAAITAAGGTGAAIKGAVDLKKSKSIMNDLKTRDEKNKRRFKTHNKTTLMTMDTLGWKQMQILSGFKEFSDVWEKIDNKPEFADIKLENVEISPYTPAELKKVSVGAGALLGALGGAALGTAGGFAAAGAVPSAIASVAVASTGTAMSTLSGAALTNAVLAWLGGGSLAVGGGGMALGTTILGVSTAGIAVLIGGVVFALIGNNVVKKAKKTKEEFLKEEKLINEICDFLAELKKVSSNYYKTLVKVSNKYNEFFTKLKDTVSEKNDWNNFSPEDKLNAENTVLSVGVLYEMCKVKLVIEPENKKTIKTNETNKINYSDIKNALMNADTFYEKII